MKQKLVTLSEASEANGIIWGPLSRGFLRLNPYTVTALRSPGAHLCYRPRAVRHALLCGRMHWMLGVACTPPVWPVHRIGCFPVVLPSPGLPGEDPPLLERAAPCLQLRRRPVVQHTRLSVGPTTGTPRNAHQPAGGTQPFKSLVPAILAALTSFCVRGR